MVGGVKTGQVILGYRGTVKEGPRAMAEILGGDLSRSQSICAHRFDEPGLVPPPKLTDVYRKPSISTCE